MRIFVKIYNRINQIKKKHKIREKINYFLKLNFDMSSAK